MKGYIGWVLLMVAILILDIKEDSDETVFQNMMALCVAYFGGIFSGINGGKAKPQRLSETTLPTTPASDSLPPAYPSGSPLTLVKDNPMDMPEMHNMPGPDLGAAKARMLEMRNRFSDKGMADAAKNVDDAIKRMDERNDNR